MSLTRCSKPYPLLAAALSGLIVLCSSPLASASPWTLPQHDLSISTELGFASSRYEYLSDGRYLRYPLDGRFTSSTLALGFRYGFTDNFEMSVKPTFKLVSYEADSLVASGGPYDPNSELTLDEARARTLDFDETRLGAGDMDIAARYNLHRGYIMVTPEVSAKIPLGYQPPRETFVDTATLERGDDVTLGDGQIDITGALLLGAYIPWTKTFIRADAGYRHRFGSPGDQFVASAKAGQFLSENVIIFAGTRFVETVTDGDVIGLTFNDPLEQDAETFDNTLTEQNPLTLDRSFVSVEAGAIVKLSKVELQLSFEEVVDGANYSDLRSVNFGVVTNFPGATRQKQENPENNEVIEEVIIEEVPADGARKSTGEEDGVEVIEEVIIEEVPVDEDGNPIEDEPEEPTPDAPESPDEPDEGGGGTGEGASS